MDTNNDEHDLAKALDSVAAELDAQKSGGGNDSSTKGGYLFDQPSNPAPVLGAEPVIPPDSPIAPPAVAAPIAPPSIAPITDDLTSPLVPDPLVPAPEPTLPAPEPIVDTPLDTSTVGTGNSELDSIKSDALLELRPLVDKLSVSPEEKFDTYLLLIRSTDDPALIAPAHEAAKLISDEARRAEALLDIIKEIDFLSKQQKSA